MAIPKQIMEHTRDKASSNTEELEQKFREVANFVTNCDDKQCLLALKRILATRLKEIFGEEPERNLQLMKGYWYETYNDPKDGKKAVYVHKQLNNTVKEVLNLASQNHKR